MLRILWALLAVVLAQAALASNSFSWGPYTVTVEHYRDEGGLETQRLLLVKGGEETVLAEDYLINVELAELTGAKPPELIARSYSGGAHCCTTVSIFALQDGEAVTLSSHDWGNGGLARVRDSDGDGKAELTMVHSYAYLDGLCYACSPAVWRTYVWEDGRFVEATRRYPGPTQEAMEHAFTALREALESGGNSALELIGHAGTYWINAYALGRGREARARLAKCVPPEVMRWLDKNRIELLRPFSALP
ncbi:MAG TPA: hypothetical protein ENJ85_03040 [Oceanithermus profundus]|uniref:Uncharacterized protein n=1 Tax=Oceanithermus profundus TaxID=187137 RepID=A0A7C5SQ13_9DEIN|nr:hypothetical protein [Oceanithermus profundus]